MPPDILRYAHIFASTVREVLELRLLEKAAPFSLSLSQFHLLRLMTLNGRHQAGELADFLGVSPPAATKNIDKLESLGLVVRTPSEGDRRATLLGVSPKGRRLVRRCDALKAARLSPVLRAFEPGELEILSSLLERFSVLLLQGEPEGSTFCLRCAAHVAPDCPVGALRGGCRYQKLRGRRSLRPTEGGDR